MFMEITQPDSFSWVSILVTPVASIVSAGLGALASYIFLNIKEKKDNIIQGKIIIEIIKQKTLFLEKKLKNITNTLPTRFNNIDERNKSLETDPSEYLSNEDIKIEKKHTVSFDPISEEYKISNTYFEKISYKKIDFYFEKFASYNNLIDELNQYIEIRNQTIKNYSEEYKSHLLHLNETIHKNINELMTYINKICDKE